MPVMRIVLLVLVVGGLTLFAFSNLSPVVSLVFLGTQTLALPLAAWMGIAIAAGALTSFFLQLLSYLQRGYSTNRGYATQSFEQPEEAPPQSRSFRRESPATPEPEPERRYSPPPQKLLQTVVPQMDQIGRRGIPKIGTSTKRQQHPHRGAESLTAIRKATATIHPPELLLKTIPIPPLPKAIAQAMK